MKGRTSAGGPLMAPVCFVIRSNVGRVKEKQAERKEEDRRPDRVDRE